MNKIIDLAHSNVFFAIMIISLISLFAIICITKPDFAL